MEQGLAATMVYGDGSGNTTPHASGGAASTPKRKGAKMGCKKKVKPKK